MLQINRKLVNTEDQSMIIKFSKPNYGLKSKIKMVDQLKTFFFERMISNNSCFAKENKKGKVTIYKEQNRNEKPGRGTIMRIF